MFHKMKRHVDSGRWLVWGSAAIVFMALPLLGVAGGSKCPGDGKTSSTVSGVAAQKGYVVNLDPAGKPVQAVPAGVTAKTAPSTHQGLTVESNPAGGVVVDLKGRFQRATVAHRDAQGRVRVECVPASANQLTTGGKE